MVVSVTEPKLLIQILHVMFTEGPVKWNDNHMTGERLQPYDQGQWVWMKLFHQDIWDVGSQAAVPLSVSTCITNKHYLFITFSLRSSRVDGDMLHAVYNQTQKI